MATREHVYQQFGLAAEAAQLFETELGTVLLAVQGLEKQWHFQPDPVAARQLVNDISARTLGQLLRRVRAVLHLDDDVDQLFRSALRARNRLNHGFFESHGLGIQTDEGRASMLDELGALHTELFDAWRRASNLSDALVVATFKARSGRLS